MELIINLFSNIQKTRLGLQCSPVKSHQSSYNLHWYKVSGTVPEVWKSFVHFDDGVGDSYG